MFYTSYFIILVQFSFVKRKKQQTVRSRSSPGCLLFMIWKENNGRNSFVCSRAALPITGKWGSCCTIRLPCDMANARLVSRAGSGSSALLRCPASASALGRASRLADRCAKNFSLFLPLAAVEILALHAAQCHAADDELREQQVDDDHGQDGDGDHHIHLAHIEL